MDGELALLLLMYTMDALMIDKYIRKSTEK